MRPRSRTPRSFSDAGGMTDGRPTRSHTSHTYLPQSEGVWVSFSSPRWCLTSVVGQSDSLNVSPQSKQCQDRNAGSTLHCRQEKEGNKNSVLDIQGFSQIIGQQNLRPSFHNGLQYSSLTFLFIWFWSFFTCFATFMISLYLEPPPYSAHLFQWYTLWNLISPKSDFIESRSLREGKKTCLSLVAHPDVTGKWLSC